MPEQYRALIVILILASFVFWLFKKSTISISTLQTYKSWYRYWFLTTSLVFLTNNFWILMLLLGLLMLSVRQYKNKVAFFFLLLFLIPAFGVPVPGFGVINYLFELNHIRLLTITLLLPVYFSLKKESGYIPIGKLLPDKFLFSYLLLIGILTLRDTTFSDTLRQCFYLVVDVFLPYVIISRAVNTLQKFKEVFNAFLISITILALIGLFEFTRHWLLYSSVPDILNVKWGLGGYLGRADLLRASASTGQAIVLGYVITVGIGLFLFIQPYILNKSNKKLIGLILFTGLISPLSRGPWIGGLALVGFFIGTGRKAMKKLSILLVIIMISFPALFIVPGGDKVINLLPFIGNIEKENITYRENLLDNSIIVIKRNLMFGSVNYLNNPEMQTMIQGQGIIDIVNSYLGIALEYGLVGVILFVGFFISVLHGIKKAMQLNKDKFNEYQLLGRVLLSTLICILITIFTVSSISFVPIVYWSISALGVGYYQMMRQRINIDQKLQKT